MSTYILMKILESAPSRYDKGICILTLGRLDKAYDHLTSYIKKGQRVIDLGCGTGALTLRAAQKGAKVKGDVISVLKTSGIEELMDHRNIILPQLAATGIESKDIPALLKNKLKKTFEMREVEFPWIQRVEVAASWAFPISIILALIMIPFWPEAILPLIFLVGSLSFLIFISFPLYSHWLSSGGKRIGFISFDFGRGGFQLILWGALILGLIAYSILFGDFTWSFIFRWSFISFVAVFLLSIDLMESTSVYKSGLHEDRLLRVIIDTKRCKGASFCERVCPRNCYEVDRSRHVATMPRSDRCIQCGACIVQCSFNALHFENPKGEIIPPETIRKFKLNLMGKRLVSVGEK